MDEKILKKLNPTKKEEAQLTVWIPKDLLKKIKKEAVEKEKNLKDIVTDCINNYFQ